MQTKRGWIDFKETKVISSKMKIQARNLKKKRIISRKFKFCFALLGPPNVKKQVIKRQINSNICSALIENLSLIMDSHVKLKIPFSL